jgi:3-oxoacyl-[acyl-carrier-protein] synthase II
MKEVFINGLGFVNSQFIDSISNEIEPLNQSITKAKSPVLKEIISPAMSRRMATAVKLGIYASTKALEEANVNSPDAIITGTWNGCLIDSEKFLTNIIENNEEYLTPTAFIQSTHNTVGSQIALHIGCKGYNFTYTNGYNSFENALLDGILQIKNDEAKNVLVGGIDEIGERIYALQQLIGEIETENNSGVKYSEGAHFMVLSDKQTHQTYAILKDVMILNEYDATNLYSEILKFIRLNNLELSDIHGIIYGIDELDLSANFEEIKTFSYKNIIGEFGTSSAFGLILACFLLKNQELPHVFESNQSKKAHFKNILLINGHKGKDLSLVLVQEA